MDFVVVAAADVDGDVENNGCNDDSLKDEEQRKRSRAEEG